MVRQNVGRIATYDCSDFPLGLLVQMKGAHRVSVCVPARNEDATVAAVVRAVGEHGIDGSGLVDELVVIDDGSLDATAIEAAQAGARVVPSTTPDADGCPRVVGKGGAMRRGLKVTKGDIVVFLDADVTNFDASFVVGLLGPLLTDERISLVKACYTRPVVGDVSGGGRITELVAKPALALLFPELAGVAQPLAGETAGRRPLLERCGLDDGYRVEIALLLDVLQAYGPEAIAQVDLGSRLHRNRPLADLAPAAREVLGAVLDRARVGECPERASGGSSWR